MGRKGMKGFMKKAMTGGADAEEDESQTAAPPQAAAPSASTSSSKAGNKEEKDVASKFLKAEAPPAAAQVKPSVSQPPVSMSDTEDEEGAEGTSEKGESRGQMVQRHKRELKAHQKAMSKLGKNKKDEKEKLDKEIEDRHAQELKQLEDKENAAPHAQPQADGASISKAPKQTKAQKRKDKLATKRAERDARIAHEREEDGPSAREVEEEQLLALLQPLELTIREIRADGHCLYRAMEDQLLQADPDAPRRDYQQLRALAAAHIRQHPDDYQPFIMEEDAEGNGSEQLEAYCTKLESTAAWGGQLELGALASALQRCIRVHAVGMPPLTMGVEHEGKGMLQLCYLRHAFGLGEHYNSVEPAEDEGTGSEGDEEQEEEDGNTDGVAAV